MDFPFTQWVTLLPSHTGNGRKDDVLNIDCINKQPNGEIGHNSYYAGFWMSVKSLIKHGHWTPENIADDINLHFHPFGLIHWSFYLRHSMI